MALTVWPAVHTAGQQGLLQDLEELMSWVLQAGTGWGSMQGCAFFL
jgi:hypothetical protein